MKVDLRASVYADLRLLAQAWGVDDGAAVERLISEFRQAGAAAPACADEPLDGRSDWIDVHADYEGTRVTGKYNKITSAVRITSGITRLRTHKSPSGAAIAVVSELNPKVNPNRNGWTFWTMSPSGETLQQVRHV